MAKPLSDYQRAIITLELSSINELSSAQQQMYELTVSGICMHLDGTDSSQIPAKLPSQILNCKSLSFPIEINTNDNSSNDPQHHSLTLRNMMHALKRSKNKLIVRKWKRGASWWNCNTNNNDIKLLTREQSRTPKTWITSDTNQEEHRRNLTTLEMAYAEIEGYRLAHAVLKKSEIHIAKVLYFSYDEMYPAGLNIVDSDSSVEIKESVPGDKFVEPWAILSYYDCTFRDDKFTCNSMDETRSYDCSFDLHLESNLTSDTNLTNRIVCNHYSTTMIKTRHEFGFDEPHPRHGRVPSSESLDYAKMILRDVIFPLHRYFFVDRLQTNDGEFLNDHLDDRVSSLDRLSCMRPDFTRLNGFGHIQNKHLLYHNHTWSKRIPFQYLDMVSMYSDRLNRMSMISKKAKNEKTTSMLEMLKTCLNALKDAWVSSGNFFLPAVLCHMDLQPQNLAFYDSDSTSNNKTNHETSKCHVAAVMDWEEACYADPRFELVLICRKVVANRDQADEIWQLYAEQVQLWKQELKTQYKKRVNWDIGSIEPWLKLECVHSLFTLVIQLLDDVGGGRSPWETKTDILGKIEREKQRLVIMGWSFCNLEVT